MSWVVNEPGNEASLPDYGRVVLIKVDQTNWIFPSDPVMVQVVTAYRRAQSPWTNNPFSYEWQTFGPSSFWPARVQCWSYIEELPPEFQR